MERMSPAVTLSDTELADALSTLDGWQVVDAKLHRRFVFADFAEAFGFMAQVAIVAERMNHHPDWSNVWNTVVVDIASHDAGGITADCVELARRATAAAG
jgi:4a-hydroxytetrahydrobiopterin dehydratase